MSALPTNFLNILKDKLEKDFVPHLPELLNKERPKADQDKKQLSRAFSGFVLHKMLNLGIADAAHSVVDDFDDNGLDAIHYEATSKTLFLVQTKFEVGKQFDEPDAIRFRNGADLLLGQRYDRFNTNVKRRKDELDDAFDEAERIQLVVAYIGTGFSAHANAALKELTENEEHHEVQAERLQPDIAEYGPDKVQADLLAEQSVGVVNGKLRLSKWQHLDGHRDTHIGIVQVSALVALHNDHKKALYERNIRYFLGSRESDVNKAIQETLRTAPNEFFYLNNGVTALADLIESPRGSKVSKLLEFRGLSVINGAQTISSAAESTADIAVSLWFDMQPDANATTQVPQWARTLAQAHVDHEVLVLAHPDSAYALSGLVCSVIKAAPWPDDAWLNAMKQAVAQVHAQGTRHIAVMLPNRTTPAVWSQWMLLNQNIIGARLDHTTGLLQGKDGWAQVLQRPDALRWLAIDRVITYGTALTPADYLVHMRAFNPLAQWIHDTQVSLDVLLQALNASRYFV